MAELMRIVRNCYFEDCKFIVQVEFKLTSYFTRMRVSSYCGGCCTPLDVTLNKERKSIFISCPRCNSYTKHKIIGKTINHIMKCKKCKFVFMFKEEHISTEL